MIISHKHKFIFVKTEKTAGTSLEIALSKHCGPNDVLSSLTPEDEKLRSEMGHRGTQNFRIPLRRYTCTDFMQAIRSKNPAHFFNHARAVFIRDHIGADIWNSYYKFCFERNPWDKLISMYYWSHRNETLPDILDYAKSTSFRDFRRRSWNLYTEDSTVIVDRVFRYDQMPHALAEIEQKIGLDEPLILPFTKNSQRKDKRSYKEILSSECRDLVGDIFRQEIALFGFEW